MELPAAATAVYESLRAEVLEGRPSAEGMAALRFHGMAQGLVILLRTPSVPPPASPMPINSLLQRDCAPFVGLLANFVLQTHAELTHVC